MKKIAVLMLALVIMGCCASALGEEVAAENLGILSTVEEAAVSEEALALTEEKEEVEAVIVAESVVISEVPAVEEVPAEDEPADAVTEEDAVISEEASAAEVGTEEVAEDAAEEAVVITEEAAVTEDAAEAETAANDPADKAVAEAALIPAVEEAPAPAPAPVAANLLDGVSVSIEMVGSSDLTLGDEVTLRARVSGAENISSACYSLCWEAADASGNWSSIATGTEYTFVVDEASAALSYRVRLIVG